MTQLPAVSLAAVPGRRLKTIEIAKEIERRGFPGIFGPSLGAVSDGIGVSYEGWARFVFNGQSNYPRQSQMSLEDMSLVYALGWALLGP